MDANLLLYAEDSLSEQHAAAQQWWDEQLSGSEAVALCWPVLSAFIQFLRITEEASGRRNTIIVPSTGVEEFTAAISEVLAAPRS